MLRQVPGGISPPWIGDDCLALAASNNEVGPRLAHFDASFAGESASELSHSHLISLVP